MTLLQVRSRFHSNLVRYRDEQAFTVVSRCFCYLCVAVSTLIVYLEPIYLATVTRRMVARELVDKLC